MTPKQLIDFYGNKTKAAAALGKSERCVVSWEKAKKIPLWSQYAIAHISDERLKPDKSKFGK